HQAAAGPVSEWSVESDALERCRVVQLLFDAGRVVSRLEGFPRRGDCGLQWAAFAECRVGHFHHAPRSVRSLNLHVIVAVTAELDALDFGVDRPHLSLEVADPLSLIVLEASGEV